MAKAKTARKYAKPQQIVKSGFRRVSKAELKRLGYSSRSALYTKADARYPTKFLTRADIKRVQKPQRDSELYKSFGFAQIKRERIRSLRKKIFRHTHAIYSDFLNPISLEQAVTLTQEFFKFLEKRYHPNWRNEMGLIYKGVDDDFSIQPRIWRDRERVITELKGFARGRNSKEHGSEYRTIKGGIIFIIGWIEQSS